MPVDALGLSVRPPHRLQYGRRRRWLHRSRSELLLRRSTKIKHISLQGEKRGKLEGIRVFAACACQSCIITIQYVTRERRARRRKHLLTFFGLRRDRSLVNRCNRSGSFSRKWPILAQPILDTNPLVRLIPVIVLQRNSLGVSRLAGPGLIVRKAAERAPASEQRFA